MAGAPLATAGALFVRPPPGQHGLRRAGAGRGRGRIRGAAVLGARHAPGARGRRALARRPARGRRRRGGGHRDRRRGHRAHRRARARRARRHRRPRLPGAGGHVAARREAALRHSSTPRMTGGHRSRKSQCHGPRSLVWKMSSSPGV